MANNFEMIAKTFQGLEEVLAKELIDLGADQVEIITRGVRFFGDKELMYKANFRCRTALRILKPVHQFTATDADEVYNKVKAIDWSEYLNTKKTFAIDAVVHSDNFRHSKFVAYKAKDAIADFFMEKYGERPSVRIKNPDVQLNIHVNQDICTLSLDSSGEPLFMRGYKVEQTEAPINEVLAAGMLKLAGWDGQSDFMDPMCGSGTIAIEAALMALNIAPGIYRKGFAFEKWSDFDQAMLEELYNDESQEREFNHKIYASDISSAALRIATENVKSAGLSKYIELKHLPFQGCERPENETMIMFNPPYGERLKPIEMDKLYEEIGTKLKHDFTDMSAWIITVPCETTDRIGLRPSVKLPLLNGSIECEFRKYDMFKGRRNDFLRERNEGQEATEDRRDRRKPAAQEGDNRKTTSPIREDGSFVRLEEDTWKRSSKDENEQSEYQRRRHEAFEKELEFQERKSRREAEMKERGERRPFNRERGERGERDNFRGGDGKREFKKREDRGGFRRDNGESRGGRPERKGGFGGRRDDDRKPFRRRDDDDSRKRGGRGGFTGGRRFDKSED
ncbi:MAG: THUMP domain-containing protein [Paludibacteraceae bacterium]|nr:THUMP domain-containing protein [Paludibacteraceae bacterium]